MDYHVKNGSHVAKAFKVRGGHTVVPAGKKADLVDAKELTEEQIKAFAREGVSVGANGGANSLPEDRSDIMSTVDVLALADGNFMAFKSAASKLLGANTPSKKHEIIFALEELATKPD